MNKELQEKLIAFFQNCDSFKGMNLIVNEYISTNKDNFDRHFTSCSKLAFKMIDFGVRFSGARAKFRGENQYYEIGGDLITEFKELENDEYEILEKYSEKVYRKKILKFESRDF